MPAAAMTITRPAAHPAVTNWQPTWSPDGKWIAYSSDRDGSPDIWKTDGMHVRRIVRGGADPDWSPGGSRIAFARAELRGGLLLKNGLATVDLSGGPVVAVPTPPGSLYPMQPSWSPDGRLLAYAATGGCGSDFGIELVRTDGRDARALASSGSEFSAYLAPDWSPDGARIAYYETGEDNAIHIVTVRTGDVQRVTRSIRAEHPSWSPDGSQLVFSTNLSPPGRLGSPFGPMYVSNLKTHRLRRLTRMLGTDPAWSPGGRRIAFAARLPDGTSEIYLVNPDGSHLVQLTKTPRSARGRATTVVAQPLCD